MSSVLTSVDWNWGLKSVKQPTYFSKDEKVCFSFARVLSKTDRQYKKPNMQTSQNIYLAYIYFAYTVSLPEHLENLQYLS